MAVDIRVGDRSHQSSSASVSLLLHPHIALTLLNKHSEIFIMLRQRELTQTRYTIYSLTS